MSKEVKKNAGGMNRNPAGVYKRQVAALLVFALVLVLSACGKEQKAEAEGDAPGLAGDTPPAATESAQEAMFSFSPDGVRIIPGDDVAPIIEKLGEPNNVFEAESCAFAGMDRIYYYSGFNISTYPAGDSMDRVLSVTFTDDVAETDQGVYLGLSKEEVIAVYGEGEQAEDSISYYSGAEELRIFFEGGKAVDIAFFHTEVQKIYDEAE